MVLDDREGIRRRAPEDWTGATPLISRKQIDRLNMGVELLTEIGSIECRGWRRCELSQKVPVRRVQNGWRRAHSVSGEHRVHPRSKRGVIGDHSLCKAPYGGIARLLQREAARLDFEQVAGSGLARFRRRRLSQPRLGQKRRARQKGRR
jgi:hypothetical protein